jgi:hypothetical protein
MKNLFNDISKEEKNRILEMHSGKKNVIFEDDITGMDTNVNEVTPKDYVLTDHAMGKTYPFLIKKNTPIIVKNGIISIKCFVGNAISTSMVSNGVNPKDVKILRPEIAKFDCKSGTFNLGEEETNENNLSTYLMSKFCRK